MRRETAEYNLLPGNAENRGIYDAKETEDCEAELMRLRHENMMLHRTVKQLNSTVNKLVEMYIVKEKALR